MRRLHGHQPGCRRGRPGGLQPRAQGALIRRALLLLVVFAALTVLHTWPLAGDIAGLSRLDNDDAGLNVFIVSWVAHVLPRDPLALFDAPILFPKRHTLAYSEHILVPSLIGAPPLWAGISSITVYNVLVLLGFALSRAAPLYSGGLLRLACCGALGHCRSGIPVAGSRCFWWYAPIKRVPLCSTAHF